MTPEEIRQAYLEWIEQYCNSIFDKDNLPGGVRLALDQLVTIDPFSFNVVSESLADMSQSFASNDGDIPKYLYKWIDVYKRLRTI